MFSYRHTYTILKCFSKRKLLNLLFDCEQSVREKAEEYENPSVEIVTVQKIGLFSYLVIWKVQGYLKNLKKKE